MNYNENKMLYVANPIIIEGIQFSGENHKRIINFCTEQFAGMKGKEFYIYTPFGLCKPQKGNYIIKYHEEFLVLTKQSFNEIFKLKD
jgi:hypothetical protein